MTYKPKDRPYSPLLASQIAKQEERIKNCGKNAWINLVCPPEIPSSIYSNRFKNGN